MRRAGIGITMALVAVVALIPAAASGQGGKSNTKLTITGSDNQKSPDFFSGRVKSANPACREGRKVRLFGPFDGTLHGVSISDESGNWQVSVDNPHPDGDFVAKVKANKKCQAAKSEKVFAG